MDTTTQNDTINEVVSKLLSPDTYPTEEQINENDNMFQIHEITLKWLDSYSEKDIQEAINKVFI